MSSTGGPSRQVLRASVRANGTVRTPPSAARGTIAHGGAALHRYPRSREIIHLPGCTTITSVRAREILDSRGLPTLEALVTLDSGAKGRAAVPSGASTGTHEAIELRDGDPRYFGKGVLRAVANVNGPIARAITGLDPSEQKSLDRTLTDLDGTPNLAHLGANAVLATSLATARAAARERGLPLWRHLRELWLGLGGVSEPTLPVPMMNILNGGAHASNNVDVQEFMVMPAGVESFGRALRAGVEISHNLKRILRERGLATTVGDEGGFAPDLASNEEGIETVLAAVERAGYTPGREVAIALDVAATELLETEPADAVEQDEWAYELRWSDGGTRSSEEMVDYWERWASEYPIRSIEDPLGEDDWSGWVALTQRLGGSVQVVGDDLFVTNPKRLKRGIDTRAATAVLVKLNQIGTLTRTFETMRDAEAAGLGRIVSHRSGETEDTFIADLVVATGAGQIKTGGASRSERTAKYNRLLEIESELEGAARFPGMELWR